MFDIDILELIIKSKEEKIIALQASGSTNINDIDNLNKEISYLKALIVRYKIAKLLKLDNDKKYIDIDFFGIEEEDINKFNLTPDEINQYNSLVAQIPAEQLQRYKIRKELFEILGQNADENLKDNNHVGVENVDPNLTKYNLTPDQINKFKSLVNKFNSLGPDITKKVNIKEEIKAILKDTINEVNIDDLNQYDSIKGPHLQTINKLLSAINDEDKKDLFTGISNYKLAIDLLDTYPDLSVELDLKGVENLINLITSGSISEEDYDKYVELLCDSINSLYKNDANKNDIERLINSIDKSNYALRYDLSSNLSKVQNVQLNLQDNELSSIFNYLDSNYDKLSEKDRDKCYELLESKLKVDLEDINKIDSINNLLKSVTNKSFLERLKTSFSKNGHAIFSSHHDLSYQSLIKDQISYLEKVKAKYLSKMSSGLSSINAFYETRISEIDKEIEKLKKMQLDYDNNALIGLLNSRYNKKSEKIIDLEKDIEELNQMKKKINSRFYNKIIDKKIEYRRRKIAKLQNSKVKIEGAQKKIMTPKLWLSRKRGMIGRHFESKSEVYQNYSDDLRQMAETERNLHSMFSGLKAAFYEFKANWYDEKASFNRSICNIIGKGKVTVKGSNRRLMNKNVLNSIRQNNTQSAVQTI